MPGKTTARRIPPPQPRADGAAAETDDFLAAFGAALTEDFRCHGAAAIAAARDKDPVTYLKICASILPRAEGPDPDPLAGLGDDQLFARARRAAAALGYRLEPEPAGPPVPTEPAVDR